MPDKMSKVCVVFGAGAKIGYSVARKYASQGFKGRYGVHPKKDARFLKV